MSIVTHQHCGCYEDLQAELNQVRKERDDAWAELERLRNTMP